jgi:hypothetical protein
VESEMRIIGYETSVNDGDQEMEHGLLGMIRAGSGPGQIMCDRRRDKQRVLRGITRIDYPNARIPCIPGPDHPSWFGWIPKGQEPYRGVAIEKRTNEGCSNGR